MSGAVRARGARQRPGASEPVARRRSTSACNDTESGSRPPVPSIDVDISATRESIPSIADVIAPIAAAA